MSAATRPLRADLFADMAHTPHQHQTFYVYAALLRLLAQASAHFGGPESANERFPFLGGYFEQIVESGLGGASFEDAGARWRRAMEAWEQRAPRQLPLTRLRAAAELSHDELTLFALVGLPDEDPRFGLVMDAMQGETGERRATPALVASAWSGESVIDVRSAIHRLRALGMIESPSAGSPTLRVCAPIWDATWSGGTADSNWRWCHYRVHDALPSLESVVLSQQIAEDCRALAPLLASGALPALIVRGPRHNGRGTLAAALAREVGRGALAIGSLDGKDDPRWSGVPTLACLLNAVVMTSLDLGPSETFELPQLAPLAPVVVSLGMSGAISGALADRAVTMRLPIPDPMARERLWRQALGAAATPLARIRMTSGNIVRAATIARTSATLRDGVTLDEIGRSAIRALERPGLEALARRVEPIADWSQIAVPCETRTELNALVARCRERERLPDAVGDGFADLSPGVRALFKGPSGTGKTLAARMVAGALGMELYRVDLAAVVNKYIGETEKNLERVFACAEELDVILLIDECDALLAPRTNVQSANDRYANLETDFLLQRLESYTGICLTTTNASIDQAFQRRMDVVIDFSLPDAAERWSIWELHLPARHEVDLPLLQTAVQRCALTGGQIRNAALHASLLALGHGGPVTSSHFIAAVEREYRKQGGVSPLRSRNGVR